MNTFANTVYSRGNHIFFLYKTTSYRILFSCKTIAQRIGLWPTRRRSPIKRYCDRCQYVRTSKDHLGPNIIPKCSFSPPERVAYNTCWYSCYGHNVHVALQEPPPHPFPSSSSNQHAVNRFGFAEGGFSIVSPGPFSLKTTGEGANVEKYSNICSEKALITDRSKNTPCSALLATLSSRKRPAPLGETKAV